MVTDVDQPLTVQHMDALPHFPAATVPASLWRERWRWHCRSQQKKTSNAWQGAALMKPQKQPAMASVLFSRTEKHAFFEFLFRLNLHNHSFVTSPWYHETTQSQHTSSNGLEKSTTSTTTTTTRTATTTKNNMTNSNTAHTPPKTPPLDTDSLSFLPPPTSFVGGLSWNPSDSLASPSQKSPVSK